MAKINKKVLAAAIAVVVVLLGATGFYLLSRDGGSTEGVSETIQAERTGFPINIRDARVHSALEKYLAAQAQNKREDVLAMLHPLHLQEWTDDSFLLTENAMEIFEEVRLGDVKLGVIDYQNRDGQQLASIYTNYTIYFIRNGNIAARVDVVEDVGMNQAESDWLISRSLRTVVNSETY